MDRTAEGVSTGPEASSAWLYRRPPAAGPEAATLPAPELPVRAFPAAGQTPWAPAVSPEPAAPAFAAPAAPAFAAPAAPAAPAAVEPATPAVSVTGTPEAPAPRRSVLATGVMALLGAVVLAGITLIGVAHYTETEVAVDPVVSGPRDGRTVATFDLLAAAGRVRVRTAELGDDLYRISAPDAGERPSATLRDDQVRVHAGPDGELEVLLSAQVRWSVRFSGYAEERVVDLSEGRVTEVEFAGGTRRVQMSLPKANGTVPVRITGRLSELTLRAPAGSPVRVRAAGGVTAVDAGARTLRDLRPGSTLTPKGWQTANRYDVDAASPLTLLVVQTSA